jgi:hypothetical protein
VLQLDLRIVQSELHHPSESTRRRRVVPDGRELETSRG